MPFKRTLLYMPLPPPPVAPPLPCGVENTHVYQQQHTHATQNQTPFAPGEYAARADRGLHACWWLADDNTLEDRHEVFDVDEGVLAAVYLKRLKGFHYQFPEVFPPLLAVVDAVSQVVWRLSKYEGGWGGIVMGT